MSVMYVYVLTVSANNYCYHVTGPVGVHSESSGESWTILSECGDSSMSSTPPVGPQTASK